MGNDMDSGTDMSAVEKAAMGALDDFMTAFNNRDLKAWRKTLQYPHVRFAGGRVLVADTPEEYLPGMDFEMFAKSTGWHHSVWDHRKVIHSTPDKVHFDVQFTRYKDSGDTLATYRAIYVVTFKDGKWGTQARSSFAP